MVCKIDLMVYPGRVWMADWYLWHFDFLDGCFLVWYTAMSVNISWFHGSLGNYAFGFYDCWVGDWETWDWKVIWIKRGFRPWVIIVKAFRKLSDRKRSSWAYLWAVTAQQFNMYLNFRSKGRQKKFQSFFNSSK